MELKFLPYTFMLVLALAVLCVPSSNATSLATFDTALFPFRAGVNLKPQLGKRADKIIALLKNSDLDLVCLQGVFLANLQRKFYMGLRDIFHHIFSAQSLSPGTDNVTRACSPDHLTDFNSCRSSEVCTGRNLTNFGRAHCAAQECAVRINSYGQPCRDCLLLYELGNVTECGIHLASDFATNYGLMLLSKIPMQNTSAVGFNNFSQFKGYLQATVSNVGNLLCTALTFPFSNQFYVGPPVTDPWLYHSFEQQQLDEVSTILEWSVDKRVPILMGNFAHGPITAASPSWMLPLHYGLIVAHGFFCPYVGLDGRYTLSGRNQVLVDHIYMPISMIKSVRNATRIFHNETTNNQIPISSHSGVKVTLKNSTRTPGARRRARRRRRRNLFQLFTKMISDIFLGY